jgi:hypothetical protein
MTVLFSATASLKISPQWLSIYLQWSWLQAAQIWCRCSQHLINLTLLQVQVYNQVSHVTQQFLLQFEELGEPVR